MRWWISNKNEEVVEYLANKLVDNLENFNDFIIVKQSKELLRKVLRGITLVQKELKLESEIYDNLKIYIQNMLYCHATSDDEDSPDRH